MENKQVQYIDKDAVVAEIERRIKKYATIDVGNSSELDALYGAKCHALKSILTFLDTLEVKEVDLEKVHYKPLDEDFERDAVSFCIDKGLNTTPYIAKTIAQHFFELGLKAQKG